MHGFLLITVIVVEISLFFHDSLLEEDYYEAIIENKVSLEHRLTSYNTGSLTECLFRCKLQHNCSGTSFNSKTSNCTIYQVCPDRPCDQLYTETGSTIYCSRGIHKLRHIDCKAYKDLGCNNDGTYTIYPYGASNETTVTVYCDMNTDDGGWTVIQKRFNGTTEFYRNWEAYRDGFGDPRSEYWLGNKWLHQMTLTSTALYVKVKGFEGPVKFAKYTSFSVSDENDYFKVSVTDYSGTAGDSFGADNNENVIHNNQKFSTNDRDNDQSASSCALMYKGGWWYKSCHMSNLNGEYCGYPIVTDARCNTWSKYGDRNEGLEQSVMMIRRN